MEVSRLHCSEEHTWEFPQGPHAHMHYSFPGTFATLPNTRTPHWLFTLTQHFYITLAESELIQSRANCSECK